MKEDSIWTPLLSAIAGGLLWGMANTFSIVFAPKPPPRREVTRALVAMVFALISAAIGGAIVAPWIVRVNHIEDVETISLTGLFVGLGFWASVPLLVSVTSRFLPGLFGRFGNVLSPGSDATPPAPPSSEGAEQ